MVIWHFVSDGILEDCGFPVYVTNRNLDDEELPLNLMPRLLCIVRTPNFWLLYIGRRGACSRCGKKKVERFLIIRKIICHMTNYVLKNTELKIFQYSSSATVTSGISSGGNFHQLVSLREHVKQFSKSMPV